MSYNPSPPYAAPPPVRGQQPGGPRPTTVTLAAGLLVGEAVLLLIGAVVTLLTRDTLRRAVDDYLVAQNVAIASTTANTLTSTIATIVSSLYALAFLALALGVLRGSKVARIICWVVAGLAVFCTGAAPIVSLVMYRDFLPGGYLALTTVLGVLQFLGYVGIIVLLALPASSAHFRRAQVGF